MPKPDKATMFLHGALSCKDPADVLFHDGNWKEIRDVIREGDTVTIPREHERTFCASLVPGLGMARRRAANECGRRVHYSGFLWSIEGDTAFIEGRSRMPRHVED